MLYHWHILELYKQTAFPSICLSVRLSVCPSVCLSICLSVRLSVCDAL